MTSECKLDIYAVHISGVFYYFNAYCQALIFKKSLYKLLHSEKILELQQTEKGKKLN